MIDVTLLSKKIQMPVDVVAMVICHGDRVAMVTGVFTCQKQWLLYLQIVFTYGLCTMI